MTQPKQVLSRGDYDELIALVSNATAAAVEAAQASQYGSTTWPKRRDLRDKSIEAYGAVCTWAAQRTDHNL